VSATAPAAAALVTLGALGLSAFFGANAKNRPTSIATVTARYKTFRMTFLADLE
jgi:hypothetical protein